MVSLLALEAGAQYYMLIVARIGGLITVAPFFGSATIPVPVRAFFTLGLGLIMLPVLWPGPETQAVPLLWYGLFLGRELLFGVVLGMAASVLFYAVQVAGQVVDTQIGFGMVNVLDPHTGEQLPVMGNLFYLLATVLFLVTEGHHHLLQALYSSFELIPLGASVFTRWVWHDLGLLMGHMLVMALRIALPLSGVLFLSDLSLGIIARTVPQMNVFILGIPSKILVGFLFLSLILPVYGWLLRYLFNYIFYHLDLLLAALANAG